MGGNLVVHVAACHAPERSLGGGRASAEVGRARAFGRFRSGSAL